MKKSNNYERVNRLRKIIFLILAIIFLVPTITLGADNTGEIEIGGGLEFINLDYQLMIDGEELEWTKETEDIIDELSSPKGLYLNGIYYLDNKLGIELGFGISKSNYKGKIDEQKIEKTNKFQELYSDINYSFNEYLTLKGGASYFRFQEKNKIEEDNFNEITEKGSGLGFRGGIGLNYTLGDFILSSDIIYRVIQIDIDEVYDEYKQELIEPDYKQQYIMNPLSIRLGAKYKF